MRLLVRGPRHVLLVDHRGPRWVLLALALACLVGAAWAAAAIAWSGAMFAVVLLAVLLLSGAVVALVSRTTIELDGASLRCTRRRLIGGSQIAVARRHVEAVLLRGSIVQVACDSHTRQEMSHEVALRCRSPQLPDALPVCSSRDESSARRFAEALCRGADLPLIDCLGEEQEVRAPGALDRPPQSRVPAPSGPPPAGLAVEADAWGRAVAISGFLPARGRFVVPLVALASFLASGLGGVVIAGGGDATLGRLVWGAIGLGELLVLAALAFVWWARTSVWIADGELHCAVRVLGVPVRRRRQAIAAIERIRLQSRDGAAPHLHPGVAIISDRATVVVGQGLEAEGRRWLGAWLQARLWPDLPERARG